MTTRAVVYARHSTEAQAGSVEQQIDAARAYAAQRGYVVAEIFQDEAKSGKSAAGREGLAALLAFVAQTPRRADVVLLWDASRLSRDQDDAAIMRGQIRKAGYRVEYVGDQSINIGGREQRIVEALADYRADAFRADLARNVKRGMLDALGRGGAWGRAPKGYTVVRAGDLSRLEPNDELPRVIEAFHLRAAGHSYKEIHDRTRLFSSKHGYSTLTANPFYMGVMRWDGAEYPAPVPAVISRELFEAVQAVNARRTHPRRVASPFLLSGLVRCAVCGRLMNGNTNRPATDYKYRYYRCLKWEGGNGPDCRSIRAPELEDAVIAQLVEYFDPVKFGRVYAAWRRQRDAERAGERGRVQALRAELARVEAAISRLTAAIEHGGQLGSLMTTLARRETERAELLGRLSAPPAPPAPIIDVTALCARIRASLEAGDPTARRLAVRALVVSVTASSLADVRVTAVSPDRLLGL